MALPESVLLLPELQPKRVSNFFLTQFKREHQLKFSTYVTESANCGIFFSYGCISPTTLFMVLKFKLSEHLKGGLMPESQGSRNYGSNKFTTTTPNEDTVHKATSTPHNPPPIGSSNLQQLRRRNLRIIDTPPALNWCHPPKHDVVPLPRPSLPHPPPNFHLYGAHPSKIHQKASRIRAQRCARLSLWSFTILQTVQFRPVRPSKNSIR